MAAALVLPTAKEARRTQYCAGDFGVAGRPDSSFSDVGGLEFEPTYDWQELPHGMPPPPDLESEVPCDGSPSRARIPPTWQLRTWLKFAQPPGYLAHDVTRGTTVDDIRRAAAEYTGVDFERLRIRFGDGNPDDRRTARPLPPAARAHAARADGLARVAGGAAAPLRAGR